MKKRLLLIRHAQSQANREGKIQGWLDSPLSEAGHMQARQLSQRLACEFDIAKIFVSPLSRATETATYLGRALDIPLAFDANLKERNPGPLSGLTKQEVKRHFPEVERAWANNLPRPHLTGAETDAEFAARTQLAIDLLLAQTKNASTTAVVSHGGTLNQMLKNWLDIRQVGRLTFSFFNTSLTIVDVYPKFIRLVLLNDTSHLGVTYAQGKPSYPQSRDAR